MQVHNKTVQLQKTNQMNTQINQAYESLSARCRQLEKMLDNALLHSSQVDGAVRQLCGAMLNGMGGEIDHSQLQQFLKTVMPLLSTNSVRSLGKLAAQSIEVTFVYTHSQFRACKTFLSLGQALLCYPKTLSLAILQANPFTSS